MSTILNALRRLEEDGPDAAKKQTSPGTAANPPRPPSPSESEAPMPSSTSTSNSPSPHDAIPSPGAPPPTDLRAGDPLRSRILAEEAAAQAALGGRAEGGSASASLVDRLRPRLPGIATGLILASAIAVIGFSLYSGSSAEAPVPTFTPSPPLASKPSLPPTSPATAPPPLESAATNPAPPAIREIQSPRNAGSPPTAVRVEPGSNAGAAVAVAAAAPRVEANADSNSPSAPRIRAISTLPAHVPAPAAASQSTTARTTARTAATPSVARAAVTPTKSAASRIPSLAKKSAAANSTGRESAVSDRAVAVHASPKTALFFEEGSGVITPAREDNLDPPTARPRATAAEQRSPANVAARVAADTAAPPPKPMHATAARHTAAAESASARKSVDRESATPPSTSRPPSKSTAAPALGSERPSAARPAKSAPARTNAKAAPSRDVERIDRRGLPDVSVVRTSWHPTVDRRSTRVKVEDTDEILTLKQGDAVGGLTVKEITPSSVLFSAGEVEIRRRVGQGG